MFRGAGFRGPLGFHAWTVVGRKSRFRGPLLFTCGPWWAVIFREAIRQQFPAIRGHFGNSGVLCVPKTWEIWQFAPFGWQFANNSRQFGWQFGSNSRQFGTIFGNSGVLCAPKTWEIRQFAPRTVPLLKF